MAGLLYFRPGLAKPTAGDLRELRLEHAFSRPPACRECTGKGPSGGPGIVFADPERLGDASIGYYGDKAQEWQPIPVVEGEPKVWIGWYKDQRPTPSDLARRDQLQGPRLRLGDDIEWVIPLLQEWTDDGAACELPRPVTRKADGAWVYGDVVPKYRAIWECGTRYWETLINAVSGSANEGMVSYDFPGLFDFACELLALNYVVSWVEVSALQMFLPDSGARIAEAAVDWPTFRSWFQKKTEQAFAGESSLPGPSESTDDTDPPAPTSKPSGADGT